MRSQYVQNDSPSSKSLAGLVVQLLQFQEDAFGRRVNNPALTKLPVSTAHSPFCCSVKPRVKIAETSYPHCCFCVFRPSVSWILRQGVPCVTSWGRSTSLRASRGGKLTCLNSHCPDMETSLSWQRMLYFHTFTLKKHCSNIYFPQISEVVLLKCNKIIIMVLYFEAEAPDWVVATPSHCMFFVKQAQVWPAESFQDGQECWNVLKCGEEFGSGMTQTFQHKLLLMNSSVSLIKMPAVVCRCSSCIYLNKLQY